MVTPQQPMVPISMAPLSDPTAEKEAMIPSNQPRAAARRLDLQNTPSGTPIEQPIPSQANGTVSMAARGMRLGFVPPLIQNRIPTACLESIDVENESKKWDLLG